MQVLIKDANTLMRDLWILLAVGLIAGITLAALISRSITKPMGVLVSTIQAIAEGKKVDVLGTERKDEIGNVCRALVEITRQAAVNLRTKAALDSCRTNVMVADEDYNIAYVNDTMQEMLEANEADLRTDLKNFEAKKVVGTNIDTFHKNPAHQRNMLDNLRDTFETELSIGGRSFNLVVSPFLMIRMNVLAPLLSGPTLRMRKNVLKKNAVLRMKTPALNQHWITAPQI